MDEFKERLATYGGPLIRDLPLQDDIVVAGGAVLKSLIGKTRGDNGDVDLFLLAPTPDLAKSAYERILQHFADVQKRDDTTIQGDKYQL